MNRFLFSAIAAFVLLVSAMDAQAGTLTDDQYVEMIDRLNDISVDDSDPGKALEQVYYIDRELVNMGAVPGIMEGVKISGSPAYVLRKTMIEKMVEVLDIPANAMNNSLEKNVPGDYEEASTENLKKVYFDLVKIIFRHVSDHEPYSQLAGPTFSFVFNVIIEETGTVKDELLQRGESVEEIILQVEKELDIEFKEQCDNDVADLGVSAKHLDDEVFLIDDEGTMSSVFCEFTQAMAKNSNFNGEFDYSGGEYEVTLTEKGAGGIILTLSKNDAGKWFSHKVTYTDSKGNKKRTDEGQNELQWGMAVVGLRSYWWDKSN